MARDLILGTVDRNWSTGLDLRPRAPEQTTEAVLDRLLSSPAPKKNAPSVEKMIKDKVREEAPGVLAAYQKYRPSYGGHKLSVKVKTNLLGDDE